MGKGRERRLGEEKRRGEETRGDEGRDRKQVNLWQLKSSREPLGAVITDSQGSRNDERQEIQRQ